MAICSPAQVLAIIVGASGLSLSDPGPQRCDSLTLPLWARAYWPLHPCCPFTRWTYDDSVQAT